MKLLPQLLRSTARCLARHEAQAAQGPLLAAVSGGLDSSALAVVLAALREAGGLGAERGAIKVVLAHVDHGVFPGSAAGTEAVERQARLLGHGFLGLRLAPTGTSEEALRDARYEALAAMARQCGAGMILTAHHADDNLETILFRMLRGTGPRGLCGIPEGRRLDRDLWVVRPFLNTRRLTLQRAFQLTNRERLHRDLPALPTVTDPTNDDVGYARNHLRHEVIPQLRSAMGVKLDASLFALARSARATVEVLAAQGGRLLREHGSFKTEWRCELQVDAPTDADRPFLEEALVQAHQRLHPEGSVPPWTWVQRVVQLLHQPDGRRVSGPRAADGRTHPPRVAAAGRDPSWHCPHTRAVPADRPPAPRTCGLATPSGGSRVLDIQNRHWNPAPPPPAAPGRCWTPGTLAGLGACVPAGPETASGPWARPRTLA